MQESTVKWFDAKKGYGFINHPTGGDDVFVHYSQIISTKDFKTLRTGQEVEFDLNDGPKGLHALDVKPLDEKEGGSKKADEDQSGPSEASTSTGDSETAAETAAETASEDDFQGDDSQDDDWEWDREEWTDENGNPPDPMASPTF
jgi:CspA family cold shock protein